jgi:hypothetical protein
MEFDGVTRNTQSRRTDTPALSGQLPPIYGFLYIHFMYFLIVFFVLFLSTQMIKLDEFIFT